MVYASERIRFDKRLSKTNLDGRFLDACLLVQHCNMVSHAISLLFLYMTGILQRFRIMSGLKWMFILMFISLMAAKLWYYVHDLSWMDNELFYGNALLPLGSKVVIYEIVTDFLSDIILIVLPIRLLKNAKLRRRQRRMIFVIFSSIIIVTFAAVFRTYFQLAHVSNMIVIGCSTITLNLLVCVPFIYRYGRT
ncbi:hypothetical protein ID866_7300, partial [Astraeus odoratus]